MESIYVIRLPDHNIDIIYQTCLGSNITNNIYISVSFNKLHIVL